MGIGSGQSRGNTSFYAYLFARNLCGGGVEGERSVRHVVQILVNFKIEGEPTMASGIGLSTPAYLPLPAGTTSITFSISSLFPALAAGAVTIWELTPGGGHTVVEDPYALDTDPQTPTGNSKSWVINPANKFLVWFTGGANLMQPGGTITLTATIVNQSGALIGTLTNAATPASAASTVNISFYLG